MSATQLPDQVVALALTVLEAKRVSRRPISLAESCTGGQGAAALTEIPGSSEVLDR
jgi:nicotinamide-nucleotide amidase